MTKLPLVLLPGTLCNKDMWEQQMNELSDIADCHVASLRANSITEMARTVLNEAPEQFALAGFSMGGNVALEVMRLAPHRVLKLALLDINPALPREEQITNWRMFIELAKKGEFSTITPAYLLPNMLHPDHVEQEALVSTIIKMAEHEGEQVMMDQMTALMHRPDGFEVLPTITCPTLLVTGRQDVLCTVQMHQEMKELIPHSKLVIIENAGHMTTIEQPKEVAKVLRHWLTESDVRTEGITNTRGPLDEAIFKRTNQ